MKKMFVPINEEGKDDCEYMRYDSPNVVDYDMGEEEFSRLWFNGVFLMIDKECGTLIDEYEEDTIENPVLKNALDILVANDEGHNGQLAAAIKKAIECDTFVDLVF